jgi:uncharacterized protein YkwD
MKQKIKDIVIGTLSVIAFIVIIAIYIFLHAEPDPTVNNQNTASVKPCTLSPEGVLSYINTERTALGVAPLTMDKGLTDAANEKNGAMISGQWWGHNTPSGESPVSIIERHYQGVGPFSWAEDVGANGTDDKSSWTSFKNSPEHYKSLIDATYTHIGVGTVCNLNYKAKVDTAGIPGNDMTGKTVNSLTTVELAN